MTEALSTKPKATGAGWKLVGFGIVTLLWLAVALYLGWNAHSGSSDNECVGTFSCLTANEWGDFLAGVFAPVAFFWLLAAVWVQSDELKVTREVMQEQADEAKKQAKFIGTQTSIISLGHADAQFRAVLSIFQFWARTHFTRMVNDYDNSNQLSGSYDNGFFTENAPTDHIEFYIEFCTRLSSAIIEKRDRNRGGSWLHLIETTGAQINHVAVHLRAAAEFEATVSPSMRLVISRTMPSILADELTKMLEQK